MDTYKIERLFHLLMERLDRHEKILDDLLYRSQRQSASTEEGTECKLYNGERLYDNQDLCLMLQVRKPSPSWMEYLPKSHVQEPFSRNFLLTLQHSASHL